MSIKYIKRKSALKPINGSIVDTTNLENKVANTYSARVIDELTGVETITNENGTAIKYPDGRMECSHFVLPTGQGDFTSAYGNVFLSTAGTIVWDYPQEFIAPPHVVATPYFQGGVGGAALSSKPTTTQAGIYPWHTKSYTFAEGSYGCEFIAKGYWK
jgi:hypothetical protein